MYWKVALLITIPAILSIFLMPWAVLRPDVRNLIADSIHLLFPLLALGWIAIGLSAIEDRRKRLSWLFIGSSVLVSGAYGLAGQLVIGSWWPEVLLVTGFLLLWIGILLRPGQFPGDLLGKLVILLDVLISAGAAAAITVQLSFPSLILTPGLASLARLHGLLIPLMALLTLVCINLLLLRSTPRHDTIPHVLLVLGCGLQVVSGMWSAYLLLMGNRDVPLLCLSLWPIGLLCYGAAAHWDASWPDQTDLLEQQIDPFPSITGMLVSVALVLAALMPALYTLVNPLAPVQPGPLIFSFVLLAGLIVLLLIRQVLTFIHNRRLYASLQYLYRRMAQNAATDPLTGLANHGCFMERLEQEIHRAQRYHHPLAVIFADLDHFKQVNDTYGHHAGDLALQKVSRTLEHSVRDIDLVARYGGEEFVVLLPETTLEHAALLAERLLFNVSQIQLPFLEKDRRRLTLSCGVAAFPETCATANGLLNGADQAMYRAKYEGRDQVGLATLLMAGIIH